MASALLERNLFQRGIVDGSDPLSPADPVQIAVVWVEKARVGSMQWSDSCTKTQLQAYRLKKKLKPVTMIVKYALLSLAFVEMPSYCILDNSECSSSSRPSLHGSGTPVWPLWLTNGIGFGCWFYFAFHSWLRVEALGKAHNLTPWHWLGSILVLVGFLDCFVAIWNPAGLMFWSSFRISRLVRPMVFLAYTKKVREAGNRVIYCIPKILDVFLALVLIIMFFSWVGLILFGGPSAEGKMFFHSWQVAISNLYILFTTANCPDIFLPAYEKHRMSFLFFCFFIILSIYLLSNVLLASVYDAYKEQLQDVLEKYKKHQKSALNNAFHLIAGEEKAIGPGRFEKFFTCLCDSFEAEGEAHEGMEHSVDSAFNRQRANGIFQCLDKDHSGNIDFNHFKMVLDIIDDPEYYMPRKAPPSFQNRPVAATLKRLFKDGVDIPGGHRISWNAFMDNIILIDVTIVLLQTMVFVNGDGRFNIAAFAVGNLFYWVLLAFSSFYVVALTLRIWVFGVERFWHADSIQNRFDFYTVYGIFCAEIACLIFQMNKGQGQGEFWLRLIVLLHLSRSLRFLKYIHPLKYIANFVTRLLPTYYNLGMLLIVVFYIYAMVGAQWFGGLIYEGAPALKGSDFAESKYWTMNFNDFPSSMVTLFVLMVINNWHVITEALILVSGSRCAAAFSVSFYVIVNMIVLNILMALLLEMSGVVKTEMEEEEAGLTNHHKSHHNYEQMLAVLLQDNHDDETQRFADPEIGRGGAAVYGATEADGQRRAIMARQTSAGSPESDTRPSRRKSVL